MTTQKAVYKAIAAVAGDLAKNGIAKKNENKEQRYKFRGIDDVYNAIAPLLSTHGLVILPRFVERTTTERSTQKGGVLFYSVVRGEFDFIATEDGSCHTIVTYGEAMDSGDKSTNKAMSAAYKYAAFQAFSIPTEGDNDADATTHDVAPSANRNQLDELSSKELLEKLKTAANEIRNAFHLDNWGKKYKSDFERLLPTHNQELVTYCKQHREKLIHPQEAKAA
jgi:hypothetical protein